ncbi:MAG: hypothetical protein K2P51_05320 [Rhabdochlamydiaceae bacterium]|nr:hypothetical protein [Rhabdochlamydiaceae bacterium]
MGNLCALLLALGLCMGANAIEVQGHRGARAYLPENSLPAFKAAIDAGVEVLELDLLMTKDGALVIHHDYFLNDRLCAKLDGSALSSNQLVRSLTLAEIKRIDCGCKKNVEFPEQKQVVGTQIPTLQELFGLIKTAGLMGRVRLNLEIKRDPRHPEWSAPPQEMAQAVIDAVRGSGFYSFVYYSSFDPESLAAIRKIDATAELGLIFNDESLQLAAQKDLSGGKTYLMQIATGLKVGILSPDHELLQSVDDVRELQNAGFRVIAWTVNDSARWEELSRMGVDGIISDRPIELKQFLQRN